MRILLQLAVICVIGTYVTDAHAASGQTFPEWLERFKQEARAEKIPATLIDRAFKDVKPIQKVIDLDRKQPESRISFAKYLENTITARRIAKGRGLMKHHHALLQKVAAKYNVQPRFIVALWGIETDFGANTGGFSIIASLATLAYEGRRSEFFRSELLHALHILVEKDVGLALMKGSWAGAMGQSQFMPSTFRKYAVDFDRDGKRDIWSTQADVFASIANYLHHIGWEGDKSWGRKVKLPKGFDKKLDDLKLTKTLNEWALLGVRAEDGSPLPKNDTIRASLMQPRDEKAPYYLVYNNFKFLLEWNRSRYFATAVGTLADALGE